MEVISQKLRIYFFLTSLLGSYANSTAVYASEPKTDIRELAEQIKGKDISVSRKAIRELIDTKPRIKIDRAFPILTNAINHADLEVKEIAIIGVYLYAASLNLYGTSLQEATGREYPNLRNNLMRAAQHQKLKISKSAMQALIFLYGNDTVTESFLLRLYQSNPKLRYRIIEGFSLIGRGHYPYRIKEFFIDSLKGHDSGSSAASKVLGEFFIEPDRVIPIILSELSKEIKRERPVVSGYLSGINAYGTYSQPYLPKLQSIFEDFKMRTESKDYDRNIRYFNVCIANVTKPNLKWENGIKKHLREFKPITRHHQLNSAMSFPPKD